jgi:2-dehydro-3-deoxyglucarate aldolase/4-hydroxy-2-oxoheptanedioate aldolase
MRANSVKKRLAEGASSYGTMALEFFTPGLPQVCQAAGAEFVLFDMEHSGADVETMKQQLSYCRGLPIVPMVRVPATEYHFIARLLDAGAMGIMVPMVETPEQAARIVACTRYPPSGVRGAAFGVAAHDDYVGGASVAATIAAAHERTLVICLVETVKGIENVDAIAAVPDVDVCWLGHFDLTNFMGIPGQFDHPRYLGAVDDLVAACSRHGKAAGIMAIDEKWARAYRRKGFRIVAYGLDVTLLRSALASGLAALRADP